MKTFTKGGTSPNGWVRAWCGTRDEYTAIAATIPNGAFIAITDETESAIDLSIVYPVGSIYMNATDDRNPNLLFNMGTWSLIDSKFLYGCNSLLSDLGDTGGATSVTLTQNNLPASLTNMTISSLSGSTSTESTDHNHSLTINSTSTEHTHSGTTKFMSEHATGNVSDVFLGLTAQIPYGNGNISATPDGRTRDGIPSGNTNSWGTIKTNVEHVHNFTTGDMSANDTHTHTYTMGNQSEHATHSHTTATTADQTVSLGSVGSATAFSILPTYRKVAMWVRTD